MVRPPSPSSRKDEVIDLAWELRVVRDDLGCVRFGHLDTWKLPMFHSGLVSYGDTTAPGEVGQVVGYVDLTFRRGLTGRPRYHKLS